MENFHLLGVQFACYMALLYHKCRPPAADIICERPLIGGSSHILLQSNCKWKERRWNQALTQQAACRSRTIEGSLLVPWKVQITSTTYISLSYVFLCKVLRYWKELSPWRKDLVVTSMNSSRDSLPSMFLSICRKILSVLFSGVDSSSGIFSTEPTWNFVMLILPILMVNLLV